MTKKVLDVSTLSDEELNSLLDQLEELGLTPGGIQRGKDGNLLLVSLLYDTPEHKLRELSNVTGRSVVFRSLAVALSEWAEDRAKNGSNCERLISRWDRLNLQYSRSKDGAHLKHGIILAKEQAIDREDRGEAEEW